MVARATLMSQFAKDPHAHARIATALQVMAHATPPAVLKEKLRSPELEIWFKGEAAKRLKLINDKLPKKTIQEDLEMGNRLKDGTVSPITLAGMRQMREFCPTVDALIERARHGVELMSTNPLDDNLGTVARAVPAGGASSRSQKWATEHGDIARAYGITPATPRLLYPAGGMSLVSNVIRANTLIARMIGKVFPNIVMTNSEVVNSFMATIRGEWGNMTPDELGNTFFFNQIVMPRMFVSDQSITDQKLFPAGHGDFPYLFAKYQMAKALKSMGVKYMLFSNADEWMWQADPVVISICQQLFDEGHHMAIIGVENINNQFGGGFVKKTDNGKQTLCETPRLPWELVKSGLAPAALNTTFYAIDIDYLASREMDLMAVEKALVVKDVPSRSGVEGETEQILGVDSWAGDVFADVLNPAFIQWPRLNFLGIKDFGFIAGNKPEAALGGRAYMHYIHESLLTYPILVERLIKGDRAAAQFLLETDYSYLNPTIDVKAMEGKSGTQTGTDKNS